MSEIFGVGPLRDAVVSGGSSSIKRAPYTSTGGSVAEAGMQLGAQALTGLIRSMSKNKVDGHINKINESISLLEDTGATKPELREARRRQYKAIKGDVNSTELRAIREATPLMAGRKVSSANGMKTVTDADDNILNIESMKKLEVQIKELEQVEKYAPTTVVAFDGFISDIRDDVTREQVKEHSLTSIVPRTNDLFGFMGRVGGPEAYKVEGLTSANDIADRHSNNASQIQNKYNLVLNALTSNTVMNSYQNPNGRPALDRIPSTVRALNDDFRELLRRDSDISANSGMSDQQISQMLSDGIAYAKEITGAIQTTGTWATNVNALKSVKERQTLKNDIEYNKYVDSLPIADQVMYRSGKMFAATANLITALKASGKDVGPAFMNFVNGVNGRIHELTISNLEAGITPSKIQDLASLADSFKDMTSGRLNRIKAVIKSLQGTPRASEIESQLNGYLNIAESALANTDRVGSIDEYEDKRKSNVGNTQ
tara:strand:+ start:512 stop:1969 length:1458 start_codon:yes stop_codon:yes gene_type:complete